MSGTKFYGEAKKEIAEELLGLLKKWELITGGDLVQSFSVHGDGEYIEIMISKIRGGENGIKSRQSVE